MMTRRKLQFSLYKGDIYKQFILIYNGERYVLTYRLHPHFINHFHLSSHSFSSSCCFFPLFPFSCPFLFVCLFALVSVMTRHFLFDVLVCYRVLKINVKLKLG